MSVSLIDPGSGPIRANLFSCAMESICDSAVEWLTNHSRIPVGLAPSNASVALRNLNEKPVRPGPSCGLGPSRARSISCGWCWRNASIRLVDATTVAKADRDAYRDNRLDAPGKVPEADAAISPLARFAGSGAEALAREWTHVQSTRFFQPRANSRPCRTVRERLDRRRLERLSQHAGAKRCDGSVVSLASLEWMGGRVV